ncbi:hypothetical protein SAMN05421766_101946 [Zobellia uliginosa]|uniref:Uncharacterized protein n=1 Tax=Zobellia uliginosa TaxID=143224 RepID=A0ABY1KJZ7_9FLAO|nr:hypothetical protein SAMN05421766_101946 [Zobellia uliginosa]
MSGRKKAIYLKTQINGFLFSSGDWTRTSDLRVVGFIPNFNNSFIEGNGYKILKSHHLFFI